MKGNTNKMSMRKLVINIGILLLLAILTFKFVLKGMNFGEVLNAAKNANPIYIFIAIGCMSMFVICEALNIRRVLLLLNEKVSGIQCLKYACVGFFYSAITPFASGGDPLQIYYMSKDKIDISSSTLAILLDLASYQIVTMSVALVSFILNITLIEGISYNISKFLFVGLFFNGLILAFLLIFMFCPKISNTFKKIIEKIAIKTRNAKVISFNEWINKEIEKYQKSSKFMKKHKSALCKNLATTLVQIICFYSIPVVIFLSLGVGMDSCIKIFSLQAILTVAASIFPMPGGVGANEIGFITIYSSVISTNLVDSSMLLARGISFYLFVILTGMFILFAKNITNGNENKVKNCL